MTESEGIDVLTKALRTTSVTIEADAAAALVQFSGGYPNAVHLLGEQAFEIATENSKVITSEVVAEAARRVVLGSAREDFDPQYLAIRGRARSIVKFIASQESRDVPSADILRHLKVKAPDISQYLDILMRSDVLVRPEQGVYRIREPLFREYLRQVANQGEEPVQRRPLRRDR